MANEPGLKFKWSRPIHIIAAKMNKDLCCGWSARASRPWECYIGFGGQSALESDGEGDKLWIRASGHLIKAKRTRPQSSLL